MSNNFIKHTTDIEGLLVIEPKVFGDHRGFFMESYSKRHFTELGINIEFVQDNHSKSAKGVLRGLHFQVQHPQGKLVRCSAGRVFDVAVDLRAGSETFGQSYSVELSSENKKMFYIPPNFAHGFLSLEEGTEILYKSTDFYDPADESGILYNDIDLNIAWPDVGVPYALSSKDAVLQTFEAYKHTIR